MKTPSLKFWDQEKASEGLNYSERAKKGEDTQGSPQLQTGSGTTGLTRLQSTNWTPSLPNHSSSSSQPSTWLPGWAPHHLCYLHSSSHACENNKLVSHSELGAQGGTVLPRSSGIFSERLGSFSLKLLCFLSSPFTPLLSMVWCPQSPGADTSWP